jgi:hypothetical protein
VIDAETKPAELTDERRRALKDALEECSETVNRAMLTLLAVTTVVNGTNLR